MRKPHFIITTLPTISVAFLIAASSFVAISSVAAQEPVIDYLTPKGSTPLSAQILIERNPGSVQVFPAHVAEIPNTSHGLISAQIPPSLGLGMKRFGVAILCDPLRESPPVEYWTADQFQLNMLSSDVLTRDILDLEKSIQKARIRSVDLQDRLQALERTLIEELNVGELRETMEEKRTLKRAISEQQKEIARLELLLDQGRQIAAPENINEMRLTLAEHLRQAAQVTAAADRLSRRKTEVARNRLKAKLKLIEELRQEDPELLARKILSLREKRRELEQRLGKTPSRSLQNDQF